MPISDLQLLSVLKQAEKSLGFDNRQFSGAVVVHLLKSVLEELGFSTSEKDVFIKDVPIEVDFLIVKPNSSPEFGVLWNPEDVIAAFELKKSGLITDAGKITVNSNFNRLKTYHPHIRLFYVSFSETRDKIGNIQRSDDSYTFFLRRNGKFSATGDYERFIKDVSFLNPV